MCRSPAAEKLLTLYGAGAGFKARSRGTAVQPYCGMSPQVENFLKRVGAADTAHKSVQVAEEDINWADLIIVMESVHAAILADKFPHSARKTRLFACGEVLDPMGKGDKVYEEVLNRIKEEIMKFIAGQRGGQAAGQPGD